MWDHDPTAPSRLATTRSSQATFLPWTVQPALLREWRPGYRGRPGQDVAPPPLSDSGGVATSLCGRVSNGAQLEADGGFAVQCSAVLCRAVPCRAVPCRVVSCLLPNRVRQHRAESGIASTLSCSIHSSAQSKPCPSSPPTSTSAMRHYRGGVFLCHAFRLFVLETAGRDALC
ncbi:hypothetical protein E2C01_039979 [Portunus trituberculatus]|uniref:Uncharacterized protein n=1 Tax=Portunus trituberculatus TaxID=210409 RepID=A0A5B7FLG9_PORTR|nr:hypothetical protein [Portunus trituberculatus]